MPESAVTVRRFEDSDEHRDFPLGGFDLVELGGMTIGRAEYEPGWRWSEHVGAAQGKRSCEIAHIGLVLSGRNRIEMDDGRVFEIGPGDHSAVIGDEPYVSIHLLGADAYAAK